MSLQVAQIAQRLDFALAVIDDRPEFANPDRFPMARVLCMPFLEALDQLGGGAQDYYVILTRGHVFDRTCLEWVLRHERAYVGMIGSRIKVAAVMTALEEAGWPRSVLEQVYSPIGLEIGAQTPAEIAVSIAGRAYPGPRPAGSRRGAAAGGAGGAVHHREKERLRAQGRWDLDAGAARRAKRRHRGRRRGGASGHAGRPGPLEGWRRPAAETL